MKKVLLFSALLSVAVGAFAQGTINLNNAVSGLTAPVYGLEPSGDRSIQKRGNTSTGQPAGAQTYGGALLAGTSYTAQLWGLVGANQPEASLQLITSTVFRTGGAAGIFVAATGIVPNTPPVSAGGDAGGYRGTFQVRAWNVVQSGAGATWAQVMNSASVEHGSSAVFSPGPALGGTGEPPASTPNLLGLTSFNMTVVPEPSTIALGVLGLGTLLFLRRRK